MKEEINNKIKEETRDLIKLGAYLRKNIKYDVIDREIRININDKEYITYINRSEYNNSTGMFWGNRYGDKIGDIAIYLGAFNIKENTIEAVEEKLIDIKRTIAHELEHMEQYKIERDKGTIGGLPSKKIREMGDRYDIHGYEINFDGTYEEAESGRLSHNLRDIEFYTDLVDEINYFDQIKVKFPIISHKDLVLYFIDMITWSEFIDRLEDKIGKERLDKNIKNIINNIHSKYFRQLKLNQPKKYNKAVKEFWKEVMG